MVEIVFERIQEILSYPDMDTDMDPQSFKSDPDPYAYPAAGFEEKF